LAADLHAHSRVSDGCLSPAELVELARQRDLATLALSDHDTMQGVAEAISRGQQIGVRVLPAVEISCEEGDAEYHLLGYCLDRDNEPLRLRLAGLRRSREQRAERIVAQLESVGVGIELARVREIAESGAIGRPHVARALVEAGYAQNVREAFALWLVRGQPGYVPREKISVAEAIVLIHGAQGVAVWAHPGQEIQQLAKLDWLMALGLDGIEVYHPDHHRQLRAYLERLAQSNQLLITGGSDFHCPGESADLGSYTVSEAAVERLMERAERHA
jgi:predicted metal-dependent phosphoesterase TrpH